LWNVEDDNCLRRWIFSDEATFYVTGRVNCHDWRICESENPHTIWYIKRDGVKVNVWCALSCSEFFGCLFL
jgi:hypothetical protein